MRQGNDGAGESLADELANLSGDEEDEAEEEDDGQDNTAPPHENGLDGVRDGAHRPGSQTHHHLAEILEDSTDHAPGGGGPPDQKRPETRKRGSSSATSKAAKTRPRGHTRNRSRYDGSEYGELSDSEISTDLPTGLREVIAEVDALARQQGGAALGSRRRGSERDMTHKEEEDPVRRLLRNLNTPALLSPQSTVESHATRLITAHTSLATHLAYQTRTLHSLAYPLLSPLSAPPPQDMVDDMLPLITSALASMPQPTLLALSSLSSFSAQGREVAATLNGLSDSLHMGRQVEGEAGRRLKSARDMVGEMRREWGVEEEGRRWIEGGNWGRRLEGRECGRVCESVVGGFEDVCREWRERLVSGMGAGEGKVAA